MVAGTPRLDTTRDREGQLWGRHLAATTEYQISSIMRFRLARAELFDAAIFANPAWDILLQLFAARLAHRQMRLVDLPEIVPRSTLARWALALEEQGLISFGVEEPQTEEVRLEISDEGAARMTSLLRVAQDLGLKGLPFEQQT